MSAEGGGAQQRYFPLSNPGCPHGTDQAELSRRPLTLCVRVRVRVRVCVCVGG